MERQDWLIFRAVCILLFVLSFLLLAGVIIRHKKFGGHSLFSNKLEQAVLV